MFFQTGFLEQYDSHTAVELWEDKQWVLYDPTFNMTFPESVINFVYDPASNRKRPWGHEKLP
jgi:transglutaminase-like putative cysteine protease